MLLFIKEGLLDQAVIQKGLLLSLLGMGQLGGNNWTQVTAYPLILDTFKQALKARQPVFGVIES